MLFHRRPEVTMRAAVLLTILAASLSLVAVTADAKTKNHRASARHAAPMARAVPGGEPYASGQPGRPAWARRGECLTDEGGGRFYPCNYGGGMNGM
jgi:hypothetical protein